MNVTKPQVIFAAEGFSARPDLIAHAEAKAAKLRRHETPRVGHVRIHARRETPHEGAPTFSVSATAETRGPDLVAHGSAASPETAINAAFIKLERAAKAAAGVRKISRHRSASKEATNGAGARRAKRA
jgi:ribosome-associated translation inhibitor RaiA